jgi:hypothetical protein
MQTHGLRPLTTRELLGSAFALWRQHFTVLIGTATLLLAPAAAVQLQDERAGFVLGSVLSLLAFLALTAQVSEAILGEDPTVRDGIGVALRRFLPALGALLGAGIVIGLAMLPFGIAAVMGVPIVRERLEDGTMSRSTVLFLAFGAVCLAVGILSKLGVRYFAILQIVVIERARNFLKRSAVLSKGAYWKVNTVWFVGSLVTAIPGKLLGVTPAPATALMARGDAVGMLLPSTLVLGWVLSAITLPYSAALAALLYYDQRVDKDGPDVAVAVSSGAADTSGLPPRRVIGG